MHNLPFDRVVLHAQGQSEQLSLQQFLDLPLHRRIRHLLNGEVEFYAGSQPVDTHEALRCLRQHSA